MRLAGSSAGGLAGADVLLQQQLDRLLRGLYFVHVLAAGEAAALHKLGNTSSSGSSDNNNLDAMHKVAISLWAGDLQHDSSSSSSSGQSGTIHLTRNPAAGRQQSSPPELLWEDKLTVIAKPGGNQVTVLHLGVWCLLVHMPCRVLSMPEAGESVFQPSAAAPHACCYGHPPVHDAVPASGSAYH